MSAISRLRVAWTGSAVTGGGVSTFYTEGDPLVLQAAVKELFLGTGRTLIPNSAAVNIPSGGETLESTTGLLTGVWSGVAGTSIAGIGGDTYAAGVGARITWQTAGITRGRRVKGATYMVPLGTGVYSLDGTLDNSKRADLEAAAQQVVVACGDDLVVWSRPTPGDPGDIWTISAASVPDKVSWLRSRRT
jgi:hypothetical protein